MEKYNTAPPDGPPQQDVDDLIFFGQTDAGLSQRYTALPGTKTA